MKFCEKCGKELVDEAVICPGCGCPVQTNVVTDFNNASSEVEIQQRKVKNKKIIILVSAILCVAVAICLIAIPIINAIKSDKIFKEISGERFVCNEDTTYSINRKTYNFDDEGNCEYTSHYYGIGMEDPMDFTFSWTFEIKFKKNTPYVILSNDDKLKIKYDEDGEIIALYDPEDRLTYERQ